MKHKLLTVDDIDHLLPQTQCGLCDYAGCKPYAEAMLKGEADIDRCHPGGVRVLNQLAELFHKDSHLFQTKVEKQYRPPAIVRIREQECIGCTKCIQACPVDAIVGAAKQMHTIIEKDCNGCELCIAPCPVDCIDIIPQAEKSEKEQRLDQKRNKTRYLKRQERLVRWQQEREEQHQTAKRHQHSKEQTIKARQAEIQAALNRVKQKIQ